MYRPMANDSYIGFGNAQEARDIRSSLFIIESHHDYGPFAFLQTLHTVLEPIMVKPWREGLHRSGQIQRKLLEEAFLSLGAAEQVEHCHPARSEHKSRKLLGFTQTART